jgi:OFA family oxalate/formate antiporter-like MFS transporter
MNNLKRWGIALSGVVLQVALGSVYAWSVFRKPLSKEFHWTIPQVTLTFTISILAVGFAAFFGGLWLKKVGPRVVAMTGGALYGIGVFLACFSGMGGLLWLYLTYGLIGGIGLGFAYIVPISVLVKWFPDRRGLMTGIAVGGFGAGALITAPVATSLISSVGVLHTFAYLGIAYLIVAVISAYFLQNPPDGRLPEGWKPAEKTKTQNADDNGFTLGGALKTWQWWALWVLLFLNTSAGISIISQEAPMFQEFGKVTVIVAASMVGIVSIGNALGRIFWAWVSDLIGRKGTFVAMFIVQMVLFWLLPGLSSVAAITIIAFLILMCYGGGFGTMPAFAADYFGALNVGSIYGLMLTAWGFASAFGPLLIAGLRQSTGNYTSGLHIIAIVMAISIVVPLIVKPPARKTS